jgi:hypothetical protein
MRWAVSLAACLLPALVWQVRWLDREQRRGVLRQPALLTLQAVVEQRLKAPGERWRNVYKVRE